jgi:Fic family protein
MPRRYEETHPWISFKATDINKLGPKFWMLVGEARSKCHHLAGTPLRPDIAEAFWRVTLVKGARATTAIEGNTLTEEEVEGILKGTYRAPESRQYQEQEVRNMLDALMELDSEVMEGRSEPLSIARICEFNGRVLKGLEVAQGVSPGVIRDHSVVVARYRGAPWEDCDYLVRRLCGWLDGPDFVHKDEEFQFALLLARAVIAHLYLAWIHPFGDGNGRAARLVEFLVLARSGRVPLPAAHLLSNHYNLTRDRYYTELDKASRSGGDIASFLQYAIQGFVDGIRDEIDRIREQHLHVSWINYVYDAMTTVPPGKTCERQRALVLALLSGEPVKRNQLTNLNPELARMYAVAGERTLARDLNRLVTMKLIRRTPGGYVANTVVLAAFLPPMADPEVYGPEPPESEAVPFF